MATEVNQALAAHAERLFDQAAGRGQRAIDQVQADLEQFARLLVHEVRLRQVLGDPGLPPLLPARAAMAAFAGADKAGELERLEGELFFVATMVEQQPAVRSALTNPGLPVANKQALMADLLDGRVSARCASLVD